MCEREVSRDTIRSYMYYKNTGCLILQSFLNLIIRNGITCRVFKLTFTPQIYYPSLSRYCLVDQYSLTSHYNVRI